MKTASVHGVRFFCIVDFLNGSGLLMDETCHEGVQLAMCWVGAN